MAKPKCPDCKRDGTYNAKFDQCSGCGRGYEKQTTTSASPVPAGNALTGQAYDQAREKARKALDEEHILLVPELVPGQPCPTCGKPVGKSKAQLQKEYRERKKK